MALYAIGDLHFGKAVDKPMDIFGHEWENHRERTIENWKNTVFEEDTVIVAGDISWAIDMDEAKPDLDDISALPGRKILVRGNHDYWWSAIGRLNKMYDNMDFIQNNHFEYDGWAVCGSRGWLCPNDYYFGEKDERIYKREVHRLRLSIESAIKKGFKNIVVATHYPPTNDKLEESEFTRLYEKYEVKKVVYGHLHGKEAFKGALQGDKNGVEYIFTACDYTGFMPVKIK